MQQQRPPLAPLPAPYAVFLPRGTKVLHLVRHGESTYNHASGAPGSSWEEPDIFDARLTERGRHQARSTRLASTSLVCAAAEPACMHMHPSPS